MNADTVYRKTEKGLAEIKNRSEGLAMMQRRLLILVDGKRTAKQIWQITKFADYEHMLSTLEASGFLRARDSNDSAHPVDQSQVEIKDHEDQALNAAKQEQSGESARDFMIRTAKTMVRPMLAQRLETRISELEDSQLFDMIEDWYRALSDHPENLQEANEAREILLTKLP